MIDQHRGGDLISCLLPTFLITFSKDDRQHLKMVMSNRIFRFTNPMTMESIEGVCEHYDYQVDDRFDLFRIPFDHCSKDMLL